MRKTLRGFYRPFRRPQKASLRHPCIILSTFSKNVDLLWRLSRSLPRPINLKAQRVDVGLRSFSVQPHFKNLTFSLPKQFHIKGHLWWSVSDVHVEAAGGGSMLKPRVTVARGQSWRWACSYIITSRGSDLCPAAAQAALQIKAVAELGFT